MTGLDEPNFDRIAILSETGEEFHILASDDNPSTGLGKAAPRGSICLTRQKVYIKDTVSVNGWVEIAEV